MACQLDMKAGVASSCQFKSGGHFCQPECGAGRFVISEYLSMVRTLSPRGYQSYSVRTRVAGERSSTSQTCWNNEAPSPKNLERVLFLMDKRLKTHLQPAPTGPAPSCRPASRRRSRFDRNTHHWTGGDPARPARPTRISVRRPRAHHHAACEPNVRPHRPP